jgi:uncharacterized protein
MLAIFSNHVLWIALVSWFVAQTAKVALILICERRLDIGAFVTSGGMPSSHSATVGGLATAVAIMEGLDSVAFAIAVILAVVVMYDAAGVRRDVSHQAVILNRIVKEIMVRRPFGEVERDLRELIGHSPFQVIVGGAVGIAIGVVWMKVLLG